MKQGLARAVCALLCWQAASWPAEAQQALFRSSVSVVRLDVLATDGRTPLTGLTADDFDVRDNGTVQSVNAVFAEHEPLDILFAFDRSASTRGDTIGHLRDSARAILAALGAGDRAGLLVFNHTVTLTVPLGPAADVAEALDSIEPEGATALFDAASAALNLTAASTRRTLILLFTDGTDTLSWLNAGTVLDEARVSDAVLYAVAMRDRTVAHAIVESGERQMRRLSESTGGRLLRADDPAELGARFLDALGEMRARYVLTYAPASTAPGWHAVTVRVKTRSARVSARDGYVVPGAGDRP
ncbi:MAG: VWA domain-containing protein [Vicinamibacterales bacterium]